MSTAQHAERILAAWNGADPIQFENELESAFHSCQKRASTNVLDVEQCELLESVVERLRSNRRADRSRRKSSGQGLSAGFILLQHLSHRQPA